MTQRNIAVVTAGLGQPSASRMLADRLAEATTRDLKRSGIQADVHTIEIREYARDIANNLVSGFPSTALKAIVDEVTGADGLIAVAPTFRASFSGMFKSFIDVLDATALDGKPVLLAATGGTPRHSLVLEHALRPVFTYMHAIVVPTSVFAATEDWAAGESATSEQLGNQPGGQAGHHVPESAVDPGAASLRARIERAASEFAAEIERRGPAVTTDPFALTTSFDQLLAGG
jgi:FMN reductase